MSAALLAAALFGVIAVAQAAVIRRRGLFSPVMLWVLAAYGVGWLLHLVAIAQLPLYLAQVGVSSSLAVTALVAAFVMNERLHAAQWAAVAALVLGLAVLAVAAGDVGDADFTSRTTTVLYSLLLLNALLGWLAWRWRSPLSGVTLGVLAGTAYGATPIATRALVEPTIDLDALLTIISVGLFGAVGFVLYSAALKRTTVTAATAPQTLLQTMIPSVVGLVAFGDQVRAGWWPVALVAFGGALLAGFVLCGVAARLEMLPPTTDPEPRLGLPT